MALIRIYLLFACLFVLLVIFIKKSYDHFYRKIKYQQILNQINKLYQNINPYQISKSERIGPEFTYGEIDLCALLDLMEIIRPQKNEIFYDLGSGCAKGALATKLRYPFLRVKAIEFVEALHKVALKSGDLGVILIQDNFLHYDFSDGNIVFINATAFSPNLWEQFLPKLQQLAKGTRILVVSKQLPEAFFLKKYQGMELMNWGHASTYIYVRR